MCGEEDQHHRPQHGARQPPDAFLLAASAWRERLQRVRDDDRRASQRSDSCGPFAVPLDHSRGPFAVPLSASTPECAQKRPRTPAFCGDLWVTGSEEISGRPDSNRGPRRPERRALPGCTTPRRSSSIPHAVEPARAQSSTTSADAVRQHGRPNSARGPTTAPGRYRRPMPAATSDILAEVDRLLEPQRFSDYCVNGLQVPGAELVSTVATGVSAHAELFELAAAERAELLLVHHGLFWGDGVAAIDAVLARRLRILFHANIALAAYHLPLDAHP